VGHYYNAKDMLQLVYLNLACYNITVHKTLAIISWCHLVSVNIFGVILHQNLFLQAKQWFNRAIFPLGVQV